jgi:hypothetical protein
VFVPPLPQDIAELELTLPTVDRNMLEGLWDELDYRLDIVGSGMELTLSIFRICKTFRVCHSNGMTYNCIPVKLNLV